MILTQDQQMIRDAVRDFAQAELWPNAARWDKERHFPVDAHKGLAALGAYGICVPEEWGGANLDYLTLALVIEEIAAGDGGTSTAISVTNCPVNAILMRYGNAAQKKQWLTPLARGEMLGVFCLTEPHVGSDASSLRTTAPGYGGARLEDKLGQHSSDTAQINFDNCRIPADNLIGAEGEGYKIALGALEGGRIGIAAQSVGMARSAFEFALSYAKERQSFGTAIFNHQAVGFRLADCATKLEAARQLIWHAASLRDAGLPCLKEAAMAKLFASEMAEEVCSAAIQTLGGYGYVSDFPVERIYRDVRVCQIYEGTSDVQKIIIQRALA